MLQQIARTPVTIDDLELAIAAVTALSPGERDSLEARTAAVAQALARRGPHEGLLLAAIHVRLAALSRLQMGTDLVDGAVMKGTLGAAASMPLRVDGDQAWFEEECLLPGSIA
jgi:hypothetical protein